MSKRVVASANALILFVLVGFLALMGILIHESFTAARTARLWTQRTYDVLGAVSDLGMAIRDAETGQRGFLLTGDPTYLEPYEAALNRLSILEGDLVNKTADNAAQQDRLRALAPLLQHRLAELTRGIQVRRDSDTATAAQLLTDPATRETVQRIQSELGTMRTEEESLLNQRLTTLNERSDMVRNRIAAGAALAMLTLVWAAWLLNQAWRRSSAAEAEHRILAGRLNTALDSLSQGVAVFGPGHRLRHWNACFAVLLDLPQEMVRSETPYAAFAAFSARSAALESEDELRHGAQQFSDPIVYERTKPDGTVLEIRRTRTPDNGFVLTITDLTKRTLAEAVLRESQKMQAIGQLTGGIAHDFNNLLTVIMGNLELGRTKLEPRDPVVVHIERGLWAAQRGGSLTSQLLAFARKQPLTPAPISLAATVPELLPLLRRTLGEHIEVRFIDSAGLWPAMADAAQLESAVLNLALNARDAMPGGGRLTIEAANKVLDAHYAGAHAEVTAGDYVMLAVSDTGHGMTPEVAARAFEPFFTTKTEGHGSGLGLAMVFGFVKQSGGHVKIYSEPDEGTSVKIYLPRAVGVSAVSGQQTLAPAHLPRGSATILVVEDEAAVREIAAAILRSLGYRVLEAQDGEDGLRMFGAHASEIDLLLTDVVLPGRIRGRELAERIAEMRPEVKILYMSGYTENSIIHHGRLDDGVALLGKPFKRDQLAQCVAQVLGRPEGPAEEMPNVVELRGRKEQ